MLTIKKILKLNIDKEPIDSKQIIHLIKLILLFSVVDSLIINLFISNKIT